MSFLRLPGVHAAWMIFFIDFTVASAFLLLRGYSGEEVAW